MPPKLAAENISEKLADLRQCVEENAERLSLRPSGSLKDKLDTRFSKDEQTWYNFLVKQDPKFTDSHRQQLSDMFSLVDTVPPKIGRRNDS